MTEHNGEEFLTGAEVAELFRVTPQTIKEWRKAGRLVSVKFGYRTVLFRRRDVEALIAASAASPSAPVERSAGRPLPALATAVNELEAATAAIGEYIVGDNLAGQRMRRPDETGWQLEARLVADLRAAVAKVRKESQVE